MSEENFALSLEGITETLEKIIEDLKSVCLHVSVNGEGGCALCDA